MLNKKILLSICVLFTLASFLMVCIATAGSTKNYKPLTNIYMGEASITHINVSKVIPELAPVLDVLSTALLAPGVNQTAIFSALKNIANTSVLAPFLTLLVNCENTTTALNAVSHLAPLVLKSSSGNTKVELAGINDILASSKNSNSTVDNLQDLLNDVLNNNSTSMVSMEQMAFVLLEDSKNPANTTSNLVDLSGMTVAEMAPMLPAFQLLQKSNNVTNTFEGLSTLMNVSIPTTLAETLFSSIEGGLNKGSNVSSIFQTLSNIVPSSYKSSMEAVEDILEDAQNTTTTLGYLNSILEANLTTSSTAKKTMNTISQLYDNSKNQTLLLTSLTGLVSAVGNKDVNSELKTLDAILEQSNNQSGTVSTLEELQTILANDTSNNVYIPYLFDILQTSKDPAASFSALLEVTSFASQNLALFTPVLSLVSSATQASKPTNKEVYDVTPKILDFLKIPNKFRLSIFTLCKANEDGKVLSCSNSHAVQDLDFRGIIYDALLASDFKPYLDALKIGANDLQLDGILLKKEHMYVPAVRAVLAFNILFIVATVGIMAFFIFMIVRHNTFALSHKGWFILLFLSLCCSLFSGVSATIVAVMITVIKWGTSKDKFNVDYKTGSAYSGLSWTAFALSFLTSMVVGVMWLNHWRGAHDSKLPFMQEKTSAIDGTGSAESDTSSKVSKNAIVTENEKV